MKIKWVLLIAFSLLLLWWLNCETPEHFLYTLDVDWETRSKLWRVPTTYNGGDVWMEYQLRWKTFMFWKQFAVASALGILFVLIAYLNVNRYSWGDNGYILDKTTGKVYPIDSRIAKEELTLWERVIARFKKAKKNNKQNDGEEI